MSDPRGPERRIVRVERVVRESTPEGDVTFVRITLDCGHVREPNPIFNYCVGERYRCFACSAGAR